MAGKCVPRLTEEPDCSGRGNGTFCIGPYALIARPPSCPAEASQDQRAPYPHGRSWEACFPARRWRRYYAPFLRLNHTLLECPSGAVTSVQRPMTACHAMAFALAIFGRRATREDGHSTGQHCRMDRSRATVCTVPLVRSRIVAGKSATCPSGEYCDNAGTGDPVDKSTCQPM